MSRPELEIAGTAPFSSGAIGRLHARLQGRALCPGDDGYDAARRIWNGMIDRRPSIIVRCGGVEDVISAIRFAREHDLLVAVRGGAHSAAGLAVCDGGIVVDLSQMTAVRVDPERRTARAQGGALWADFDSKTSTYGLATTGGMVSNTGIGGLTLGGGIGWLMGKCGLTCDNILSAKLVTAEGELITACADDHPDLLWALKGGGGNFGIVVSFEYSVHPIGPQVLGGIVLHRREHAREVLRFYRDFVRTLPDDGEAEAVVMTSLEGEPMIALLLGYNGPLGEGEDVLGPARRFGKPVADSVAPMSYVERQCLLDGQMAVHGYHRYWKSGLTPELSDDLLDVIVDRAGTAPSPLSLVGLFYVHGEASRVARDATAFGSRGDQWDVGLVSQWVDPAESDHHVEWTRSFFAAVEPHLTNGVYVNHIAADEPHRVSRAFGGNYERLVAVKNIYDPGNVFRMNHNIKPAVTPE
jgi:FAD/FMN-containing dehydrogenase